MLRSLVSSLRAVAVSALAAGAFVAALATVSGCVQPCGTDHLCAVDSDKQLCDGTHWAPCDDSNRNQRVSCPGGNKAAVCTTTGWTFQSN